MGHFFSPPYPIALLIRVTGSAVVHKGSRGREVRNDAEIHHLRHPRAAGTALGWRSCDA